MEKLHLLYLHWSNAKKEDRPSTLILQLEQHCHIHKQEKAGIDTTNLALENKDLVLCELEYVDFDVLRTITQLRQNHPSIPIVMVTIEHSEELAVWALRNRIWDYYLKPLSPSQFDTLLANISNLCPTPRINPKETWLQPLPRGGRCPASISKQKETAHNRQLGLAINYIDNHLATKITASSVAEASGISNFQLRNLFQKVLRISVGDYIMERRLLLAKKLLLETNEPIGSVATSAGFNDPSYFTRIFKRCIGTSPSDFRDHGDNEQQGIG